MTVLLMTARLIILGIYLKKLTPLKKMIYNFYILRILQQDVLGSSVIRIIIIKAIRGKISVLKGIESFVSQTGFKLQNID